MTKRKRLKLLMDFILIILGNTLLALSVVLFIIPNNLTTGGTTGLALIMNKLFGIRISVFTLIFNVIMFFIGLFLLGKKFAVSTMISTFSYPIILEVLQRVISNPKMTSDMMLATIFAGIIFGTAIGIVIKAGGSTGGMDIPPLVVNKYFSVPVSIGMYAFDFVILLLQLLVNSKEMVLYGIFMIFIYTVVIDKVLMFGNGQFQIKIVSQKSDEISEIIAKEFDRGFTYLYGRTGYIKDECNVILTVVSNRQLSGITERVQEIDPEAFVIVSKISEVKGRGFTKEKIRL